MPDISKCIGRQCELKETCYRYTSKPSEYRQSYFSIPPLEVNENGEQECEYYWPDKQKEE
jgi:hypothetical protein